MEDQLKNLRKLLTYVEELVARLESLESENKVLHNRLDSAEEELATCKKELKYIRELRDRALKKIDRLLEQLEEQ